MSRRKQYFFDRYGEIADSLKGFFDGIESITQTAPETRIVYGIIFNEKRTQRFGKIPSFLESIQAFERGESNNIIFGSEYWPYYIAANPVPIVYGALTLIRAPLPTGEKEKPKTVNNEIDEESLETLLSFSNEIGISVFHNMDGVGASKLEAHWQGVTDSFQIEFAKREEINRYSGIYSMLDYPGENFVFTGKLKIKKSLELSRYLDSISIEDRKGRVPYTIILANNNIYIIPIRNENAGIDFNLNDKSRIGGYECGNCRYIALNKDDFKRIKDKEKVKLPNGEETELHVKEILKKSLFEKGKILKIANHILSKC
jgi:hypothetical protein